MNLKAELLSQLISAAGPPTPVSVFFPQTASRFKLLRPWQQRSPSRLSPRSRARSSLSERIQLSNGMVIFLQEDHELPGWVTAFGRSHSRRNRAMRPASQKVGLVGTLRRSSGARVEPRRKTGDQMDDFLEVRAAKVENWRAGPRFDHHQLELSERRFRRRIQSVSPICSSIPEIPLRNKLDPGAEQKQADGRHPSRRNDESQRKLPTAKLSNTGVWEDQSLRAPAGIFHQSRPITRPGSARLGTKTYIHPKSHHPRPSSGDFRYESDGSQTARRV